MQGELEDSITAMAQAIYWTRPAELRSRSLRAAEQAISLAEEVLAKKVESVDQEQFLLRVRKTTNSGNAETTVSLHQIGMPEFGRFSCLPSSCATQSRSIRSLLRYHFDYRWVFIPDVSEGPQYR